MPTRSDLAELPPEVRRDMTFVPVRTLEDVLAVALPDVAEAALGDEVLSDEDEKAGADVTGATGATPRAPRSIDARFAGRSSRCGSISS